MGPVHQFGGATMYIKLNRSSKQTLTKQLYFALRDSIFAGQLNENEKIPSSRDFSTELEISRNVVMEVYDQLLAEGYLYSKERSGTFVTSGLSRNDIKVEKDMTKKHIFGLMFEPDKNVIDFRTGVARLQLFPQKKWAAIYKEICTDLPTFMFDYYQPKGCYELRYQLSLYLKRVRGVECEADQIVITSGAAQSFSLLSQFFKVINPTVLVEDPISKGIVEILSFNKMDIKTVPLDEFGLKTEHLSESIKPSLIFTTPSHQFPTGAILPIKRRIDLIKYAEKMKSYIIEDDYDSEFRFEGFPIQSMQSLSPERIIYVGTFSKILCPALRLGYMIIPKHLDSEFTNIKYINDLHSPILEQLTLASFIKNGYLDRHVRKSKKLYEKKCKHLIKVLKEFFGTSIEIYGEKAGMHLMVRFKNYHFTVDKLLQLRETGVNLTSAAEHAVKTEKYKDCLLFGFGNLSEKEITEGCIRLKNFLG